MSGERETATAPPIVRQVLQTSGKPLDPQIRMQLEATLPADLLSLSSAADSLEQDADRAAAAAHQHRDGGVEPSQRGSRGHFDFSGVRVHDDALAAVSARTINAHAYTSGSHIVFDSGRYDPHSSEGRKLLAHELTHVVQQSSGSAGRDAIQRQPNKERTVRDVLAGMGAKVKIEPPIPEKVDCNSVTWKHGEIPDWRARKCLGDAEYEKVVRKELLFRANADKANV